jgi:type IV pili sensor histidine kinase/response regulator
VHYLLRFSGYSLVGTRSLSKEAAALLMQPLPAVDRHLGPMTLEEGLQTLVGKPFGWLVDPVHRLLSLRLLPNYQPLYQTKTIRILNYFGKAL